MARITGNDFRFETPDLDDPANLALITQRLAEQFEPALLGLEEWFHFMQGPAASGNDQGEAGTPAIWRSTLFNQAGFPISQEKNLVMEATYFNNTNLSTIAAGDLILPDQDQRYWWWFGVNIFIPAITVDARFTGRLYVQDRDPATGEVLTTVSRYNQYMRAEGEQYMLWDGLYRSGGGRCKVTMAHGSAATTSVLAGSSVWAVRICPDR